MSRAGTTGRSTKRATAVISRAEPAALQSTNSRPGGCVGRKLRRYCVFCASALPIFSHMKAVIPVAGIGSRLRPHTHTQPKTLVPVAGNTILGHIIDRLVVAGRPGIRVHHWLPRREGRELRAPPVPRAAGDVCGAGAPRGHCPRPLAGPRAVPPRAGRHADPARRHHRGRRPAGHDGARPATCWP